MGDPITIGTAAANLPSEAAKGIFNEVKRHMRYVIMFKKKVDQFEEKLTMLMAKRMGVQQQVEAADRNGEKIKADVELWCSSVDKAISEEEKKVKELEEKAKKQCFLGLCPNIKYRYQLSRKAEEDSTTFDELIQRCQFGSVGFRDLPQSMVDAPSNEFESFKSREKVFNGIMEALKDDSVSMIGVYGMAGVGKTTLVKEVARLVQVQGTKLFDSVVTVIVTQSPDIQKIQDQIAEMLGLNLEEKSTVVRARRLCERLKKEKRILLVLDDIWRRMDLEEVGIPFGNQHRGCKILLTSRDQNVLSNEMDAQKTFGIRILDHGEAWDLLKNMAGESVESVELRPTAIEVAKKCARLPVAIATVGRALRNKSLFAWKDALRQLRRPSSEKFTGIPAEVYSAIELSYNHLDSEELKQIFLLCGLLRRHTSINYLLRYAIGLGLINGVNTVEEARDRLLTMVSSLKASCLLIDGYTDEYFDMHDLVYNVAMSIASKDNHVFALDEDDVLIDWPDRETMNKCNKIRLQYPSIQELPDELNCPKLVLYLMFSKDLSLKIPANFFRETTSLKVLNWTKMQISSLPSSIILLKSLSTLCLDQCELGDISIIGELKNLEILSLFQSNIRILPKELGQLVKMKLFDLSHCTKLRVIPPGLLSSLSKLEELYMANTFIQWDPNQRSNASLAELKTLSRLTTLEVHVLDAKFMPADLFFEQWQKLERYKIFIGKEWQWIGKYECSRTLKLSLSTNIDHLDHGLKMLLKKTEALYLDEVKGVKMLKDAASLPHLKNLHIQNGREIKYIINDTDATERNEFLQLRSLTLEGLPQLISFCPESQDKSNSSTTSQYELPLFNEKMSFPSLENLRLSSINVERIWHNWLSNKSFKNSHENLSRLIIQGCDSLKCLLSFSMARHLVHLKFFKIVRCKWLREIVFVEDIEEENKDNILFPQLNFLEVRELQHLIGFCSDSLQAQNIELPSLKSLKIEGCPELQGFIYQSTTGHNQCLSRCRLSLFDEKVSFPSLENLIISELRNMKMIWQNKLPANSFCKLQQLKVKGCDELLTIFPSNMLATFPRLQTLSVKTCVSLEYVFGVGSLDMEEETHLVTTQLRQLTFGVLPNLKYIWKNDSQGIVTFENLQAIYIWGCWRLMNVFPASIARALPQLKDLKISNCGVEEIVSKQDGLETTVTFKFDQLSSLRLWNLPQLKCFYPGVHTAKWPMLKRLYACWCPKMKILSTEHRLSISDMVKNGQLEFLNHPPLFLVEEVLPKLEKLSLNSDDIEMMSESQYSRSLFHEIKVLRVVCYYNQSAVFPVSFLERFYNLEKLAVISCHFNELFSGQGDTARQTYARTLPTIRYLKLHGLHKLQQLWKKDARVDIILPSLEMLKVINCDTLICLGTSSAAFQNLTTLDVYDCKAMVYLVTSFAVQSLVQLKKLRITHCISMKEVVGNDGNGASYEIIFSKLQSLELWNLPRLKSFCSSNHAFGFPSLEEAIVEKCPNLEIFCKGVVNAPNLQRVQVTYDKGHWSGDLNNTVQQLYAKKVGYDECEYLVLSEFSKPIETWMENIQGIVDFRKLRYLEVCDCIRLKYILTVPMALDLQQIKEIKVKNCPMMEQIIIDGAATTMDTTIMLPRLQLITIESCSNLNSFYLGNNVMECPSLKSMSISDCPKMFAFTSTFQEMPEGDSQKWSNTASFFNDKVWCPNLQFLTLSSINIKKIWSDQLRATSSNVQNLRTLTVIDCHNLKHLFIALLVKNFVQLHKLAIQNCKNMEEIIYTGEGVEAEELTPMFFPKLERLALRQLPKLARFCHEDNSNTHDSPALFTEKISLPRLIDLRISGMGKWRKIWDDKVAMDSFCELEILEVKECKRLVHVFPFNMTERLEKLETLHIVNCGSLEEIIGHSEADTELIESTSTTTFVFPKLQFLVLKMLPKLKKFYSKMHTTKWPSLKELWVVGCNKVEIFAREHINFRNTQGESQLGVTIQQPLFWVNKDTFPNLEELLLDQNDIMKEIWQGQLPTKYFCKLNSFWLKSFPNTSASILNLVSDFVSFKHLATLTVSECHGLTNLVTLIMAKSMVLLTRLSITNCQMIEEIVTSTSDEVKDGIIFSQLKFLKLCNLPSLSAFCSGNYAFEFPSLEEVIMRKCPNMKIFTKGELLSTPMLKGIQSTKGIYVGHWEGDLNAIVRQLFIEKVYPRLGDLEQSSINIQRIWHDKLLATHSYARNLTWLTIEGCHNMNYLFSFSMVASFVQLKKLNIENCENVETVVIFMEGLAEERMMSPMSLKLFRMLQLLSLKDLPSLTRFCHGNFFEFSMLRILWIQSCPTLKTFISNVEGNNSEIASPTLFNEKVAFPCLEDLTIIGMGKWRKIWHEQPTRLRHDSF